MVTIQKYNQFNRNEDMSLDFINSFYNKINESNKEDFKDIKKRIMGDLRINLRFMGTFGAGIGTFLPIVTSLMSDINGLEITTEAIVLSTICAFSIIYLEEKKFKDADEEEEITRESKSMLEELKLRGVGNGIIKKLIKSFKSILNIFNIISKNMGAVINGFVDMFAYTALLIPIMNGISYVIGKYELNIDTLTENFVGLSIGVGTLIAKHGIKLIINKLGDKFKGNKKEIIDSIDIPDEEYYKL